MTSRVLLTTPDYPPKLGGLSTFTQNIERCLKERGDKVDLLVWKNIRDLKYKSNNIKVTEYDYIMNIHFQAGIFLGEKCPQINFFHGSEILFTSPSIIKKWIKKLLRKSLLSSIQRARYNIAISQYTLEKLKQQGCEIHYSRDLIFPNCIDLKDSKFKENKILDTHITFCCIARDVPHKNHKDVLHFLEGLSQQVDQKIILYTTGNVSSTRIEIHDLKSSSDQVIEQAYQKSDFNLLFSLDHSKYGFYEGFGLTVLEAGKYGVPSIVYDSGGLVESVHHKSTGWVCSDYEEILKQWASITADYCRISRSCYIHTHRSHGLNQYKRLFEVILER